jgi:magnesium-transporting ATPase (P-type)
MDMPDSSGPPKSRGMRVRGLIFLLTLIMSWFSFGIFMTENLNEQALLSLGIAGLGAISLGLIIYKRNEIQLALNILTTTLWFLACTILALILAVIRFGIIPSVDAVLAGAAYFFTLSLTAPFPVIILLLMVCQTCSNTEPLRLPLQERKITPDSETHYDRLSILFDSVTKRLLDPTTDTTVVCPACSSQIDFRQKPVWYGPTAFMCPHCASIVHMHQLGL